MTRAQMEQVAKEHGMETEVRGKNLYVIVPWSCRTASGGFETGVEYNKVTDAHKLYEVLGY